MFKNSKRMNAVLLALMLLMSMVMTSCGLKITVDTSGEGTNVYIDLETKASETAETETSKEFDAGETASSDTEPEESAGKSVTIIYTNDVHSYVNNTVKNDDGTVSQLTNYASLAALKKSLQEAGENVLLVDAGDHVQGTAFGGLDEGASVIELMNAAGYDAATLGNHEFDYGQFRLFGILEEAEFSYLSCNFTDLQENTTVLPAYEIFETGDVKVALIGITTPDTYTAAPKVYFQDGSGNQIYGILGVEDPQDLYDSVQAAIDEIGDQADYIIALGHLGVDESSAPCTSREVIANTSGLDAFIDGHSHTCIEREEVEDASGNTVVLTQTGSYLKAIGVMSIDEDYIDTSLVTEYPDKDEDVNALTEAWVQEVDAELGQQMAVSDVYFTVNDGEDQSVRLVRRAETNLGDLIADSVYYYFNEVEELNCDAAFINGGGVRCDLPDGDVNYTLLKTIQPFGNVVCLIDITGQELLEVLEYSAALVGVTGEDGTPAEFGGFLQTAGLQYTIDSSIESSVQTNEAGDWVGAPTGERKVSDVKVYNRESGLYEDLDPEKIYTIGGINYILRNGGNGYSMLCDNRLVKDYVGEDYLIAAAYLMSFTEEDGFAHISTENSPLAVYEGYLLDYEDPAGSGRIEIK